MKENVLVDRWQMTLNTSTISLFIAMLRVHDVLPTINSKHNKKIARWKMDIKIRESYLVDSVSLGKRASEVRCFIEGPRSQALAQWKTEAGARDISPGAAVIVHSSQAQHKEKEPISPTLLSAQNPNPVKKKFCSCMQNDDPIRSQFCTCHNSWAVVTCANLWPD